LPGGLPCLCKAARDSALICCERSHNLGILITWFREVRRVLRSDGTLWLNVGDTCAGRRPDLGVGGNNLYESAGAAMKGQVGCIIPRLAPGAARLQPF